ncbi:eukaryotic rRNA processing protein EBP2-domain-containing protein [Podospora appendiculata]|uniref:Eukaryotic rRNA processing protein EBP2-domain-containing protein n=1 Tax=Podospora appendiculata TaxID=314037 RepID=A0AAE0X4T6_9PEZI|nr:eukaryotic rRNA processing protein EBP2-domain-containing protein [Podospora appendiculata]
MAKEKTSKAAAPKAKPQQKKAVGVVKQKSQKTAKKPVAADSENDDNDDDWEDAEEEQKKVAAPKAKKADSKKQKVQKQQSQKKAQPAPVEDNSDNSDDESDDPDHGIDYSKIGDGDSDSDSESEFEHEIIERKSKYDKYNNAPAADESDDEDDDDEEDDIDLDDVSIDESDEENVAASSRIRQTINNKEGLLAVLRRFALDVSSATPFVVHQSVVSKAVTEESIPTIDDDLARELAFMNQSLEAARAARKQLKKDNVPFTRPTDYFAETLRSDSTMEKVKEKLIEDATAKKASAEARKLRDLKKFGKSVQNAKLQERAKEKRATLDKITQLKRKRQDGTSNPAGATEEDIFDVAVDNELNKGKKRSAGTGTGGGDRGDRGGPNKRQKKDYKFGFGGKTRHAKSGDKESAGDLSGFNAKRMKKPDSRPGKPGMASGKPAGKAFRPGKGKRKAAGGKR